MSQTRIVALRGTKFKTLKVMGISILLLFASLVVMHCNQNMDAAYWVAVVVMIATSLKIADKLDSYG